MLTFLEKVHKGEIWPYFVLLKLSVGNMYVCPIYRMFSPGNTFVYFHGCSGVITMDMSQLYGCI